MDKRIIHAVAGSGKTRFIIESLDLNTRTAIITYTITNQMELKNRIIATPKWIGSIIKSLFFSINEV